MLSSCLRVSRTIARRSNFHHISPIDLFLRRKLKQNCIAYIGTTARQFSTKDGKDEQKGEVQEPPKDTINSPQATPQQHSSELPKHSSREHQKPEAKKGEGHKVNLGNLGNVASTITFTQEAYVELEKALMDKFHEKNQSKFRAYLLGTILILGWISIVFGARLRKYFTEQTAGLAKETLENESLKIQTQELATAVVQTILEDKDITSHAATFLKEASTAPETQQALLKLTMHILQHKDTMDEVTKITQKLIKNLANDKDTIAELALMFEKVLADPALRAAMIVLVGELCQDKEVFKAVSGLVVNLAGEEKVTKATSDLLTGSVSDIMQDEDISHQSRQFIADVVGDDLLQKEGGHALWKSINYALKPGIIRVTGVTLVVASVGFAKLMLSPY